MNKNKVYIVMEPERINSDGQPEPVYDLSDAEYFGELVRPPIFPRTIIGEKTESLVDAAKKTLDNITENDYILLIGDPVAIGLVLWVAGWMQLDNVNMLRWNPKVREYYAVRASKHNKNNNGDNDESIRERSAKLKRYFPVKRRTAKNI